MNASALLKSQGWRGRGHSLHPTDNAIGLANPLLLSRNTDGSGLGANKTFTDQWWLAAFDQKLKGLDVSKKGVVVQSVKDGALDAITSGKGGRHGGLYASFVRGGLMEGTLSSDNDNREESTDATPVSEDREGALALRNGASKRKESIEERRARKEAKRLRKAARAERRAAKAEKRRKNEAKEPERAGKDGETKEERRARRANRRARKEQKRKRREERAAMKAAEG